MASTPPLWMETRCASVTEYPTDYRMLEAGCHQTSREGGSFGSIGAARRHFLAQGWRIVEGRWLCPVCAAHRDKDRT